MSARFAVDRGGIVQDAAAVYRDLVQELLTLACYVFTGRWP
jgi:hypothetical protein